MQWDVTFYLHGFTTGENKIRVLTSMTETVEAETIEQGIAYAKDAFLHRFTLDVKAKGYSGV